MEWLNFRHLYAFWSVCHHGGFQKAARRIHVSQSTISEQVAQLESYLEEKLLERTKRFVKPTERGTALLEYADQIFEKSLEINHVFRDKNEAMVPTRIRIGMVGGISRNFIFGMVFQNLVQERGTKIHVVDGSFGELNGLLKGFELDLIFSLERPPSRDLLTLDYKKVESSPLCLAGKPELIRRLKRRRSNPVEAELYMFRHPFERESTEESIAERFNLDIQVPLTTDDISLLRFLANAGRGFSLVPEIGVLEDLGTGQLARVRLDDAPQVDFYATFLKSGFHRELIEDFLA